MLFSDLSANDLSQNVYRHCSGGDASVTDNDRNLATILWSIRWSGSRAWKAAHQGGTDGGSLNSEHRLMVTMDNLERDQSYRLQLLFNEKCCTRGFDIWVGQRTGLGGQAAGGSMIVQKFSPERVQGGIHALGMAALVSYDFVATDAILTDGKLQIEMTGEEASTCSDEGINGGSNIQSCGFPDNNPTLMGLTLELCNQGSCD